MSPQGGYQAWDFPFLRPFADDRNFYLGGRFYVGQLPEGIQRTPSPGATVLPTHARTHKVHIPYTGSARPDQRRAYNFSLEWQADDQDDYLSLLDRGVSSEILDFCCFWWVSDRFAPTTSGTTYQLSRRRAAGLVSGVDESGFPSVWLADDTPEDSTWPSALAAQTWQAPVDNDEVIVRYLPLTRVVITKIDESVAVNNDLRLAIELSEVLQEP